MKYGPNKTYKQLVFEAKAVHSDFYCYPEYQEYLNTSTPVTIICPRHGSFRQSLKCHIKKKQRCKKCAREDLGKRQKMTWDEFKTRANTLHSGKYTYPDQVYCHSKTKVDIVCLTHGIFQQTPNIHLCMRVGCPSCADTRGNMRDFVEKANAVHDFRYSYPEQEFVNSKSRIRINCEVHGEFRQTPNDHLSGKGCTICGRSYGRKEREFLDHFGVRSENRQYLIKDGKKRYIVDGFDPSTNTIYEFDGDYWHGNPAIHLPDERNHLGERFRDLLHATLARRERLRDLGYSIVSMWEDDFDAMKRQKKAA